MKRPISIALAAVLTATAPGAEAYQAAARVRAARSGLAAAPRSVLPAPTLFRPRVASPLLKPVLAPRASRSPGPARARVPGAAAGLATLRGVVPDLPSPEQLQSVPAVSVQETGHAIMDRLLGAQRRERPSQVLTPRDGVSPAAGLARPTLRLERAGGPRVFLARPERPASLIESPKEPSGRVWRWLTRPFRVLSDPQRNRQFWILTAGDAVVALGGSFHYTGLGNFTAARKEDADKLGMARSASYGGQAVASFGTGPMINSSSEKRVLAWTHFARSLVMLLIPTAFFHGWLSFPVLFGVLLTAGFLQNMGGTAGAVALNKILGKEEAAFNRANAVYSRIIGTVSVIGPLIAGAFVALVDLHFGLLSGSALAYAVYAALVLAVAAFFGRSLRVPQDELSRARRELSDRLLRGAGRDPRVKRVSAGVLDGRPALFIELRGDPSEAADLPSSYKGFRVDKIPFRRQWRELIDGFRLILRNRFLLLSGLFAIPLIFTGDAIIWGGLQGYIRDVLGPSVEGLSSGLRSLPLVGPLLGALTSGTGAFGVFLAASALGSVLSTFITSRMNGGRRAEPPPGRLDPLERQARWTSILYGVSLLAHWFTFFSGNLWISVAAMGIGAFLQGPGSVVWSSLRQRVIKESYPQDMAKVYAALSFYELVLGVGGVLFFGFLMKAVATVTVLWVICLILTGIAVLNVVEPFVVLPTQARPKR